MQCEARTETYIYNTRLVDREILNVKGSSVLNSRFQFFFYQKDISEKLEPSSEMKTLSCVWGKSKKNQEARNKNKKMF